MKIREIKETNEFFDEEKRKTVYFYEDCKINFTKEEEELIEKLYYGD